MPAFAGLTRKHPDPSIKLKGSNLFNILNKLSQPNQLSQLNKLNQLNQLNQPLLKPRRRSPFAEGCFAGSVFSDMLFQLFAP